LFYLAAQMMTLEPSCKLEVANCDLKIRSFIVYTHLRPRVVTANESR
jgi:hypothetical protein